MTFEVYVPPKKQKKETYVKVRFDENGMTLLCSHDLVNDDSHFMQILIEKQNPKKIMIQKCEGSASGSIRVKEIFSGRKKVKTIYCKWTGYKPS